MSGQRLIRYITQRLGYFWLNIGEVKAYNILWLAGHNAFDKLYSYYAN